LDGEEHGGSLQKISSLETGKTFFTNLRDQENLGTSNPYFSLGTDLAGRTRSSHPFR
jgi:hypothetical protein